MPTGYESGKAWSPIGAQATVSTSAASRVWTLNEVAAYEGADSWPAPVEAFALIESKVLSSAVQSVTFSSIPQIYQDLRIVARATSSLLFGDFTWLQINGDTTDSNYRILYFGATANGAASGTFEVVQYGSSAGRMPYGDWPKGSNSRGSLNERQALTFTIPAYSSVSANMESGSVVSASAFNNIASPNNNTFAQWTGQVYNGTSAYTSLTLHQVNSGTNYEYQPGTEFSLYGIGEKPT